MGSFSSPELRISQAPPIGLNQLISLEVLLGLCLVDMDSGVHGTWRHRTRSSGVSGCSTFGYGLYAQNYHP